ncbi:M4 family metallopeptidase [Nocardioides sp. Soil796]|uniref:M4 family metallopeptidase n=1 Tax=Nocardioides sp. Soil796 TaxID=1736412 RepID=UPI000B0260F3|nr:M4 family metallopeptidase [Nocardioides sp. Soil796]
MKFLRQGIALAVVGAGLAAVPGLSATASPVPAQDDKSLVQQMRSTADGSTKISAEGATGKVGFVRAARGGDLMPSQNGTPAAKADAYLDKYAEAFGAPRGQLVRDSIAKNDLGTSVAYVQEYKGVPVFGTLIRAFVDKGGDLTSVNGEAVPDLNLSVTPKITEAEAGKRAVTLVKAQPPTTDGKSDTSGVKAKTTTLTVYRSGLVQGVKGKSQLVYQVEVTNEKNVRDMVFLNADTGKVVNRYSTIDNALDRELYEADANRNLTLVWKEGDALPGTLNEDQESMVRSTGDAFWFFKNSFGRDSYDANGAKMRTINNDPAIQCPNANWNGVTTNYCDGVSSDDVVAHEWGHAYTEYTHGLIYQWQSGALNEGYSDVWGETVDLINGRLDEGEGDLTKKRTVGMCSSHSAANPLVTINSPATIAKDCLTGGYMGPVIDAPITSDVVIAADAVEPDGGTATDGCSPYTNAADVAGKIVMVDRGLCTFVAKAEIARDAGAAALIIGNRDDSPIGFSSPDTTLPPTASIGLTDRESIRSTIASGTPVSVTLSDASGTREDSYRWLIGEKSEAFGGAIRDMWNPTCYGDPGKVSDAEYKCSTDDNGGVHGNSGVVNHGYALLVDGGTYNATAVRGIGLDKAAAIYYQAMTVYQTPVSNFTDHANSLEASCADLTNKAIKKLSTRENDSKVNYDKITADDCAQVAAMTKAVEFRLDPTEECGWQPLLAPNAPAVCGEGFETQEIFSEDFESGMDGWTLSGETVNGSYPEPADWATTSEYRGDHTSSVAKGNTPDQGDCAGNDISSANYMTSDAIAIPDDASAPRMTFEHYIATETGYDGGNVRISVNDGEFVPVPADAFTFNGPLQISTEAEQNTNPLAGEPGFTGTDPGTPFGSWGESQIDLAAAGVSAGDSVELQFAIGRDGCGGVDGWYVDNIEVLTCEIAADITATVSPARPKYGTAASVKVNVTSIGDDIPTGDVTVTEGDTELGTATLNGIAAASIALPKTLSVGKHTLTVTYSGDDNFSESTATLDVTVAKATGVVSATAKPSTIRRAQTSTVTVTVKAAGVSPTGKVTIVKGAKVLGSATLSSGRATIRVAGSKLVIGKNKLTAKYAGSATVAAGAKAFVITVTR